MRALFRDWLCGGAAAAAAVVLGNTRQFQHDIIIAERARAGSSCSFSLVSPANKYAKTVNRGVYIYCIPIPAAAILSSWSIINRSYNSFFFPTTGYIAYFQQTFTFLKKKYQCDV